EQRVAESRAAGDVAGPVARIHVADGDEVPRPGEGEQLSPEARRHGHRDGAVDLRQAEGAALVPPRDAPASRSGRLWHWIRLRWIIHAVWHGPGGDSSDPPASAGASLR